MSDEIKDLSDLVCQDDELELSGGEGGGVKLKRSEMNLLARMSDVYPITREERRLAVDCLVDIIKTSKSRRTKISSVKALTGLDRTNQNQMALYLTAKKMAVGDGKDKGTSVNVNVAVQNVSVESVLDEYRNVIQGSTVPSQPPQINGTGKQIHSPETNGKAS